MIARVAHEQHVVAVHERRREPLLAGDLDRCDKRSTDGEHFLGDSGVVPFDGKVVLEEAGDIHRAQKCRNPPMCDERQQTRFALETALPYDLMKPLNPARLSPTDHDEVEPAIGGLQTAERGHQIERALRRTEFSVESEDWKRRIDRLQQPRICLRVRRRDE